MPPGHSFERQGVPVICKVSTDKSTDAPRHIVVSFCKICAVVFMPHKVKRENKHVITAGVFIDGYLQKELF